MKICVFGLWHLGSVTAACLAGAGHSVVGLDEDPEVVEALARGRAPISEPGLDALVVEGLAAGRLRFTTDSAEAVRAASVLWVTFDTPVSEDDVADVGYVTSRVAALLPALPEGALVIVSSQLPVGTTRALEPSAERPDLAFAALPENLRLGTAIEVFTRPDRVIAGVRSADDRERVRAILAPITDRIEWMSVESAEMTKHAINAFLATSVTFINEIAMVCESVGADAKEVERGLKSEARIGPKAYLSPGGAFAGGTLARDIAFLTELGNRFGSHPALIASVKTSNDNHKRWTQKKLQSLFPQLQGLRVCVWGLTYKAGTDTLRRSSSVELCRWLAAEGVVVVGHDPAVDSLPSDLGALMTLGVSATDAAKQCDALVVATEGPAYREVDLAALGFSSERPTVVLDPNRFLSALFENESMTRYYTIGKGAS
ncbi:MAG TPA: nucleotide sugar dehydrogenase [Polyangiaceae bacterium]